MGILNGLMQDIQSGIHLGSMSSVMGSVTTILELMESNYVQDKDAKNAAIDTICQILQKMKS